MQASNGRRDGGRDPTDVPVVVDPMRRVTGEAFGDQPTRVVVVDDMDDRWDRDPPSEPGQSIGFGRCPAGAEALDHVVPGEPGVIAELDRGPALERADDVDDR